MSETNTIIEETTEENTTVETDVNENLSPNDYKIIVNMMREMDDQYNTMRESVENTVRTKYGFKEDILDFILPYEREYIDTMDPNEIKEFLNRHLIRETDPRYKTLDDKDLVKTMGVIKDLSLALLSTKTEAESIRKESGEVLKEYFTYMSSDKIKKSREKRLEAMKKALESETDELAKSRMVKMIEAIEATINFSFLEKRFDRYGDKEINNIKECYFEDKRGKYIMDRYRARINRFGFNPEIYKYFFNIEENFLPKKYSPFNNLFLFIYMRMVAYSDPNDKTDTMLVQAATGALANLIYHKFNSTENEQYFLQVIMKVLDRFEDSVEYFKENNTTYEEHPARKEAEANHEKQRKENIIKMLNDMNISGYDPDASADDLLEFYNKETELMIQKQVNQDKEEEDLVVDGAEEVETEEVSITPTIVEEGTESDDTSDAEQ